MSIENFYFHCGTQWSDDDCDSFHNDRCPVCNAEIEPYKSQESGDPEEVHHPLSNEMAFDLSSGLIVAAKNLVDKTTEIPGVDVDDYARRELSLLMVGKSRAGHAISDGGQANPFEAVLTTGDDLAKLLSDFRHKLYHIPELDIGRYESAAAKVGIALRNWEIYRDILAERTN